MKTREVETGLFSLKVKDDVKKLVNSGRWFMYSINSDEYPKAEFLIEAGRNIFLLNRRGSVIADVKAVNKITKKERIYFKGIPFPDPLPEFSYSK